jgi:hypothetical protein
MAKFKVKSKKAFYLADIKKRIYDPKHKFDTFKKAVGVNMVGQMYDNEKYFSVVPLEEKQIKKLKFKEEKII